MRARKALLLKFTAKTFGSSIPQESVDQTKAYFVPAFQDNDLQDFASSVAILDNLNLIPFLNEGLQIAP